MSSTDQKTENSSESDSRNDQVPAENLRDSSSHVSMEGGVCKESFMDHLDCLKEAEKKNEDTFTKCEEVKKIMNKCIDGHPDYYSHPMWESMIYVAQEVEAEWEEEVVERWTSSWKEEVAKNHTWLSQIASGKCTKDLSMLINCMNDCSDYYQPILAAVKAGQERYQSLLLSKLMGVFD